MAEGNRRLARGSFLQSFFFVGAITFPVTVGKCIGKLPYVFSKPIHLNSINGWKIHYSV